MRGKAENKKWPQMGDFEAGIASTTLESWEDFHSFVTDGEFKRSHWIFRGQRRSEWPLESTLARMLRNCQNVDTVVKQHRKQFQSAICGRRGSNPPPLKGSSLWALGQHHGLATELLDWTASPYVALFFAYAESKPDDTDERIVFALNQAIVSDASKDKPVGLQIEIVKPLSDENARLISQAGAFITWKPFTEDLERLIRNHFRSELVLALVKIRLPSKDRLDCLKALNRMNINYATLFPDLTGASRHCNLGLEIPNYTVSGFEV
jgi:hypothetical protein